MSEIIGNRYQITKLIGKGGMADVYLAVDTILNREVAIKILKTDMSSDPVSLERFSREAIAATKLSHPNIVDVYDVGDDGDKHYIVMEYVKGYTLKQLIKKRGAIPYKEAVWMTKQIAGALMAAHRSGMVHRDVKSQNVLIKDDGTIKLTDFGIALAQGSIQLTSKDSILGSVHYLAPEIAVGKVATMQSDIYSLGIVMYELLTGDIPYKSDNAVQVALMHVKGQIPSVRKLDPRIPQSVENILIKATAKSTENRYKNVALMLKDLNNCLKPEYKDCAKLVLDKELESKTAESIHVANKDEDKSLNKKKKKKKKTNPFSIVFLVAVFIIAALCLVGILFFTGIIGGNKNKTITVPDVSGLTIIEASDILDQNKLILDTTSLTWVLTDDKEEGIIISTKPEAYSIVDINTRVSAIVSEGKYSIIESYENSKVEEATSELQAKGFKVNLNPVESNVSAGLVIDTNPTAGEKYNPSSPGEITINYSKYDEITLPEELKGAQINKVCDYFDDMKIKYKLSKQDKSFFSPLDIDGIEANRLVYTEPSLGLSYTQLEDNFVTIYYYEED